MKALTIAIPTYNRAQSVARQLRALDSLGAFSDSTIEVLVGNNASTDSTRRVLQRTTSGFQTKPVIVDYSIHVGSAEENIARLIRDATGDFVWLLSDDDVIVRPTYSYLLSLVRSGERDCYVFDNISSEAAGESCVEVRSNSIGSLLNGLLTGTRESGCIDFMSFIECYGLTSYGALISRYVVRRQALGESLDEYLGISPIYSHVFGLLEALSGKRVEFISSPLIWRRDSDVQERFERFANERNKYVYHPWTHGLIDLTRHFESRNGVAPGWLSRVSELDPAGRKYSLVQEIFNQACRQIIRAVEEGSISSMMPADEFSELSAYLEVCGAHRRYLRELSVLSMEVIGSIEHDRLYGAKTAPSEGTPDAKTRAHSLISVPYERRFPARQPNTVGSVAAQIVDRLLFRIEEKRPRIYSALRRVVFHPGRSRSGILKLLSWLRRASA